MKYLGYLNINIIFYRVYKRRASMSSLRFNHRFNIIMIRQVCGSNDTMLARVVIMRCASQINLSNCTREIGITKSLTENWRLSLIQHCKHFKTNDERYLQIFIRILFFFFQQ